WRWLPTRRGTSALPARHDKNDRRDNHNIERQFKQRRVPDPLGQADAVARSPQEEVDHPGDAQDHRDRRHVKSEQIDFVESHLSGWSKQEANSPSWPEITRMLDLRLNRIRDLARGRAATRRSMSWRCRIASLLRPSASGASTASTIALGTKRGAIWRRRTISLPTATMAASSARSCASALSGIAS